MYEEMDDNEFLLIMWQDCLEAEEFLQLINDYRPYLYEEAKFYLRSIQGV